MSDVYEKLLGIISQRFLLAYFLPLLFFVFLNQYLIQIIFQESFPLIMTLEDSMPEFNNPLIIFLVLSILMVSYIASPFSTVVREILKGRYLPQFIAAPMISLQVRANSKITDAINNVRLQIVELTAKKPIYIQEIKQARVEGGNLAAEKCYDNDLSKCLEEAFAPIIGGVYLSVENPFKVLENAVQPLVEALKVCNANCETEHGKRIDRYHQEFISCIKTLEEKFDKYHALLDAERQFHSDGKNFAATKIGNLYNALIAYAHDRYGMSYEIFWPHLVVSKMADEEFNANFTDAEAQLDFLVNTAVLTLVFLILWMALFFFSPEFRFNFSLSGLVTEQFRIVFIFMSIPIISLFLYYKAILHTYKNLFRMRRSAIDLFRLEVLRSLRIKLPEISEAESEIWNKLHRHIAYGEDLTGLKFEVDE